MPKFPRDLSSRRVCKALERMGFKFVHQVGSHKRYVKGPYRVTVSENPQLPVGTLKSILQQANITLEDLERHL